MGKKKKKHKTPSGTFRIEPEKLQQVKEYVVKTKQSVQGFIGIAIDEKLQREYVKETIKSN